MTDDLTHYAEGVRTGGESPLALVAVVVLLTLIAVWRQWPRTAAVFSVDRVVFVDPDDYTRVCRAEQIAEGRAWRIRHQAEINYPTGVELHWTAPMDYLLVGADLIFGGLVSPADRLARASAYVPAALGLAFLAGSTWLVWRGVGLTPAVLSGLVVVLSPAYYRVFQLGHPDHHCLLELLLLIAFGGWWLGGRPGERRGPGRTAAIVSGSAMGLAVWVAAQAMLFWFVLLAVVTWLCVIGAPGDRRVHRRMRLWWTAAVACVVAIGFLVENWPDLNAVAVDKISLLHLVAVVVSFLAPARWPSRRLLLGLNAAFAVLAAIFIIWVTANRGRVFEFVSGAEFYRWSEHIAELQPLITQVGSEWSFQSMHARLGFLPYALPILWWFFWRAVGIPRVMKFTLGPLSLILVVFMLLQLRWVDHFGLAVAPVAAIGVWELVGRWRRLAAIDGTAPRLVLAAVILGVLMAPAARWVVTLTSERAVVANAYQGRTDFAARRIVACEQVRPAGDTGRRAILCEEGEGPALLCWTGLPVVAAPYHRGVGGVVEAAKFFAERDPTAARAQLDRLGVRYVVVPTRPNEQLMQFEQLAFGELRSFDPPTWTADDSGRPRLTLHYRPEVAWTMAYRLVMESGGEVIPGVERAAEILEGATDAEGRPMKTGLVYVVRDLPIEGGGPVAPLGEGPSPR